MIADVEHAAGNGTARAERQEQVTITYCVPCGYESRAKRAAESLADELGLLAELNPGKGGVFQVAVAGQVVTARRKGYFPDDADIVQAVREALHG